MSSSGESATVGLVRFEDFTFDTTVAVQSASRVCKCTISVPPSLHSPSASGDEGEQRSVALKVRPVAARRLLDAEAEVLTHLSSFLSSNPYSKKKTDTCSGRVPRCYGVMEGPVKIRESSEGEVFPAAVLVEDFFKACPLHNLFYEHNQLSLPFVRCVLRQVGTIMQWINEPCGVAYRDLKLPNVLVDGNGRVYIVDFGCAARLDAPAGIIRDDAQQVHGGAVGGGTTRHICAPEMLAAAASSCCCYGTSVDVWAFGVLAFELLEGAPPFGSFEECARRLPCAARDVDLPFNRKAAGSNAGEEQDAIAAAQSLIRGLLEVDPRKRLGCRSISNQNGSGVEERGVVVTSCWSEVLSHPFFLLASAGGDVELDSDDGDYYSEVDEYEEEIDMQTLGL